MNALLTTDVPSTASGYQSPRRGAGRYRRLARDAGISLPEVLIASMLSAVLGSIVLAVVVNVTGGLGKTENDVRGLQDARTVQERLSRDLRQARWVSNTATSTQLTLWIDDNGDYVHASTEDYLWQVVTVTGTARRQVQRKNLGTQKTEVVGRNLVSSAVFTYNGTPVNTSTVVGVDLQYNATVGKLNKPRSVTFSIRMRNHG